MEVHLSRMGEMVGTPINWGGSYHHPCGSPRCCPGVSTGKDLGPETKGIPQKEPGTRDQGAPPWKGPGSRDQGVPSFTFFPNEELVPFQIFFANLINLTE